MIIQQTLFLGMVSKISSFAKETTKCGKIFSTYKSIQNYRTQNLIISVPCADEQIAAAKYQLHR